MQHSPSESRRFGLNVYRADLETLDEESLLRELFSRRADLAIVRLPAVEQHRLPRLDRVGLPYVVADTLVYYFADLKKLTIPAPRNPELEFVEIDEALAPALDELVAEIFGAYVNHYASNPLLRRGDAVAGYREWARGFVRGNAEKKIAWLVRRGGAAIGFCTCAERGDTGIGVLYGIRASASGGGIYGDMIRFTSSQYQQRGFATMEVSTQVHNFAVQKVWSREGFAMQKAMVTVHVNALFDVSARPPEKISLAAGDDLAGALARCHEKIFPSAIARTQRFAHLAPLPPSGELIVTFPIVDESNGHVRSVAKLADARGELCLLAYSELFVRSLATTRGPS